MKKKDLEEKIAYRDYVVGNTGSGSCQNSYCTNCKQDLGSNHLKIYGTCPECKCKIREGETYWS